MGKLGRRTRPQGKSAGNVACAACASTAAVYITAHGKIDKTTLPSEWFVWNNYIWCSEDCWVKMASHWVYLTVMDPIERDMIQR